VLTELLSDPKLPAEVSQSLCELPLLEVKDRYSRRAAELRAKVLAKHRDIRAFAEAAGLDLIAGLPEVG